ncbi:GMC oxidoreductase [Brucella grignonensis]|nr:GMC oxidoreductase [Brucella grignonensis]
MERAAKCGLATVLDVAGPIRGTVISTLITSSVGIGSLLTDDASLTEFVRKRVGGTWHPSGTYLMGAISDPMIVTDSAGKVHCIEELLMCDASLMPSIPFANTNIPTIMIAERMAGTMIDQWSVQTRSS